jgi:hypothetical protein
MPYRKFLFSPPSQEGVSHLLALRSGGRTDQPDINDPATSPAVASGGLLPPVYSPWDGNQLETRAHVEHEGYCVKNPVVGTRVDDFPTVERKASFGILLVAK